MSIREAEVKVSGRWVPCRIVGESRPGDRVPYYIVHIPGVMVERQLVNKSLVRPSRG